MPIRIDELRNAAKRARPPVSGSLTEARQRRLQTAFLCHSHRDRELVEGLLTLLRESGWQVYVDWADEEMPETPTRETAARIKARISELTYFLFLATPNSTSSKWCPWEIGYADGVKPAEKILVVPTTDSSGKWFGNEYLQLYRHIDRSREGHIAVWHPGQTSGELIRNL